MAGPPRYRIHPAIGIARVGNARADEFFVGPERPGQAVTGDSAVGTTVPAFKDAGGLVKRMAARFRIFEYVESGGLWTVSREITAKEADSLTWTVHLANRKASFFQFNGLAGSPLLKKQPSNEPRNKSVRNRRALDIDPLPRSISGAAAKPTEFRKGKSAQPGKELWPAAVSPVLDYLGELRTDAAGRLLVLGGTGQAYQASGAGPLSSSFNNDGWFDDVSDGPVTAELYLKVNGKRTKVDVQPAWVLVGPPDFGPGLKPMVTLYDLLFDVCAQRVPVPKDEAAYRSGELQRFAAIAADLAGGKNTSFSSYKVSFDDDVLPILRQIVHASFVFAPAAASHFAAGAVDPAPIWASLSDPSQGEGLRKSLVARLRLTATDKPVVGGRNMPKMLGDDRTNALGTSRWGLVLTSTQLAVLDSWQNGKFIGTSLPPGSLLNPPAAPAITPHGLDRAALEGCSGGAFYPGIEVGWQIRDAAFSEPFRLAHGAQSTHRFDPKGTTVTAGHFSRQMALPWLTDFLQCRTENQKLTNEPWAWWPTQRPDSVYPSRAEAAKHHQGGTLQKWARATTAWPSGGAEPSFQEMRENWSKFGFVVQDSATRAFFEDERNPAIP
jgi:hypothetical protein